MSGWRKDYSEAETLETTGYKSLGSRAAKYKMELLCLDMINV
jgi:hypothetical protein